MVLLPRPARLEPLASVFSTTGGFGSPPKPVYTSLNGVLTPAPGTSTHQNPVYAARELDTAVGRLRTAAHRSAARKHRKLLPAEEMRQIDSVRQDFVHSIVAPRSRVRRAGAAHRCASTHRRCPDRAAARRRAAAPRAAPPVDGPRAAPRFGERYGRPHTSPRDENLRATPSLPPVALSARPVFTAARLAGTPAPARRRRRRPPPSPSTFSARSTASAPPPTTAGGRAASQCRHTRRTGGRRGRRSATGGCRRR